jgi:hypothetical protein
VVCRSAATTYIDVVPATASSHCQRQLCPSSSLRNRPTFVATTSDAGAAADVNNAIGLGKAPWARAARGPATTAVKAAAAKTHPCARLFIAPSIRRAVGRRAVAQ